MWASCPQVVIEKKVHFIEGGMEVRLMMKEQPHSLEGGFREEIGGRKGKVRILQIIPKVYKLHAWGQQATALGTVRGEAQNLIKGLIIPPLSLAWVKVRLFS